MEKCICENCGAEILKYKSDVRKQNFCNIECLREHRLKNRVVRTCKNCGKEFSVAKSTISERTNGSGNFCCRRCYNEYQRTLLKEKNNHCTGSVAKCANCGKDVWQIPSREKLYKNRFCSKKCKSEYHHQYIEGEKNCNWKGGIAQTRGSDFERIKREKFQNSYCALCGTKEKIHIHHIIPYRLTQDNSYENLIPLCAKHHKIVENLFVKNLEALGSYETTKIIMRNILYTYLLTHRCKRKESK